ncbi:MAG: hypothetical protein LIP02_05795 [Bacteroidales bacterium]|nr:hypothetical protein [Bacteroidales bacterium]
MTKTNICLIIAISTLFTSCGPKTATTDSVYKDSVSGATNTIVNGILPNTGRYSWDEEENVAWIYDQLRNDSIPQFDLSGYGLSDEQQIALNNTSVNF